MGIQTGGNINILGSGNVVDLNVTGPASFNDDIAVAANVISNNVIANGYFYANLDPLSSYTNADAANYLPTYTGNLGNVNIITASGAISTTATVAATGNVSGGNVNTAGSVIANDITANASVLAVDIEALGNANVATLNVSTLANITSGTAATSNTSGALQVLGGAGIQGNVYVGSNLVVTSSVTAANTSFTNTTTQTANITAVTAANSTTTGALKVAGGASVVGNVYVGGIISGSGNLSVAGNGTFANVNTANLQASANIGANGNITAKVFKSNIADGTAPLQVFSSTQVANLNAQYAGTANSVAGANVSGAVGLATYATTANAVAGANVSGTVASATVAASANSVAGANVSGQVASAAVADLATYATTANAVAGANVSGAVAYATTANSVAGANVSGTVASATVAASANSVAGANVSGTVSSATVAASANSVTGANVSGAVAYATTANAVAGANVSGEVSFAATANSVAGANVSGQVANALVSGTVYTNAQPNITSVGTLTSLNLSGDIVTTGNVDVTGNVMTDGNISAQYFIGDGSLLTGIAPTVQVYEFANIASGINGYYTAEWLADYVPSTVDNVETPLTTTPTYMGGFITQSGYPGITVLPVGSILVRIESQKASGPRSYSMYAEIYQRTAGGTETLLVTTDSTTPTVLNTVIQQNLIAYTLTPITLATTDRIVVKIYGTMLSGSDNVAIRFDDNTGSGLQLPALPASAGQFLPYTGATQDVNLGTHNLSTSGNIVGANIGNAASVLFGNGANITGLPAMYSNADVATYLASGTDTSNIITTANVIGSTIGNAASVLRGDGGNIANIQAGNVVGTVAYAATANSVAGANVTGAVGLATFAGTANSVAGSNVSGVVANATYAVTAGTANSVAGANVSGAVSLATFAGTANSIAGANVSGQVSFAATANAVAGANVSGQVGNALVAGTVYTAAQPNITSVGTLSTLEVSGNVLMGNANIGNLVVTGTTTTAHITNLDVSNSVIVIASGANALVANGAGLLVGNDSTPIASMTYRSGSNSWTSSLLFQAPNINVNDTLFSPVILGNTIGNAASHLFGDGGFISNLSIPDQTGNIVFSGTNMYPNATTDVMLASNLTLDANSAAMIVPSKTSAAGGAAFKFINYANTGYSFVNGTDASNYSRWQITANGELSFFSSNATTMTGNITTPNGIIHAANIEVGNVLADYLYGDGSNITGLAPAYGNANVSTYLSSGTMTANIVTSGNANVGSLELSSAVSYGNVSSNPILYQDDDGIVSGDVTGLYYDSAKGLVSERSSLSNVSLTSASSGSMIIYTNPASQGRYLIGNNDFTFDQNTGEFSVPTVLSGNIGNAISILYGDGGNISNITAISITGTVANATYAVTAGTANSVAGANVSGTVANATYAVTAGTANSVAGANVSGTVALATSATTAGTANSVAGSNVSGAVGLATFATTANAVAGANVSGAVTFATTANAVAGANVSGTVASATVAASANSVAGANVSGTVASATVAASANSVAGANVSGTVASATVAATANSVDGSNVSGAVGLATFATTANAVAGANVSGAVALATSATSANSVAGANVSGAVAFATTANSVAGANVSGAVGLATFAGTANAVAAANVSGTVASATVAASANSVAGANVSGQVANALVAGTVYTAAQPTITSVGTLTSLNVSGNANVGNIGTTSLIASGSGSFGANVDMNSFNINNLAAPSANSDAATKQYVDGLVSTGLYYHPSVAAATTTTLATTTGGTITYNNGTAGVGANIVTTGSFNLIDTANVQTIGTRILVKNEANAALNGVYTWANATTIVRSTDTDSYGTGTGDLSENDYFFVAGGSVNIGTAYVCSTAGTIVFGTTNINFSLFSTSQVYAAGTGLGLSGTTFSLSDTTVSIGSYGGSDTVATFTVNQQGQLTAASNVVIQANAANLSGTTLKSTVVGSSLTSVGTLTSLNVSGNANVGNLGTAQVLATANVTAPQLISNITTGTAPLVVASTTQVANLNAATAGLATFATTANAVAGANVSGQVSFAATANSVAGANVSGTVFAATTAGTVTTAAQPNITSVGTLSSLTTGALTTISGTGRVTLGTDGGGAVNIGRIDGVASTPYIDFNSSATTVDYDARIQVTGNTGTTGGGTLAITADLLSTSNAFSATGNVTGSYFVGNGSALTSLTGANVTGTVASATVAASANSVAGANVSGAVAFATTANSVAGANVSGTVSSATTAGTVTTAAQGNITSVGTLTSLAVSGALTTTQLTTGANTTTGNITGTWSLTAGSTLIATYADLAEKYAGDAAYEPGTVVMFGGENEVTLATEFTSRVAGIVSTNPAYVMNDGCAGEHIITLALQGRVPCRVIGSVRKGDMMVSAGNGYARACDTPTIGTVIGKAIENFDGDTGVIEIGVGRL